MKLRRWLAGGLVALALAGCGDRPPAAAMLPPAPAGEAAASAVAAGSADPPAAAMLPPAPASEAAGSAVAAGSAGPPAAVPTRTVDVSGTIEPVQGQGLSFGVAGTVAEVDVAPGQAVRAGAVLARLDTASLQSQLKQGEAQVASAEAALAANRAKVANDRLAVQQAQDDLQQKQADLATARAAETLTAPVAGVVESVAANVGESLSPGQTVLTIVPPGADVTIETQVAQQSSQAVQVGDTASASIPATDQTVSGAVSSVGTGSAGHGGTDQGTIDVTIALGSPPADLRDGMTALVNIYTSPGAPVQATGAIQYADEWQVTAPQGGTAAGLPVQPGESVSKGQVVATLTGTSLAAAVQGAEQAVQQAQLALAQAQANVQADQGGQQAADQASLESAKAAEQAAQANLQAATLTAPFAGTVGQVRIAAGQQVSAGATQSQGSLSGAITLIGNAGFEVTADVPDRDMGEVHVGEKAWVTAAGAATPAQAIVAQITPQATGGAFPVTLTIIGNPSGFLTGAAAEVSIQVGG
jgi:multidrug efflux pump subunit AcrA (membrane-fusion protein)